MVIVNRRGWNAVIACNLKNDRMISVHFQGKPFSITVIQVCAPTRRSWSWIILWRPTRPSRTNTQKKCPFHYRGLECKSRKSRDTCSNRQIWPWSTKWSRAKANRVLSREGDGQSKHPLSTTQEKNLHMDITRWSIPISDWLYSLQPRNSLQLLQYSQLCIVSKIKTRSWLWLRSWTLYFQIQT